MRALLDVLYWIVGLIMLVLAIWQFYLFVTAPDISITNRHLLYAVGAAIVFAVCMLLFFLRHVNKEEEIHITQ